MLGRITVYLLIALLVWGNIVSGLGAGLACPDWPLCYGKYLPPLRWDIVLEKGHRVLAAVAGIALISLCLVRVARYRGWAKGLPLFTLLVLAIQIPLGGLVVLLGLPVNVTTMHFALAITIFSLALYIAYFDGTRLSPRFSLGGALGLFFFLGLLVVVQSVLGAYVRHSGSALACGMDFPKCLGYLVPPNHSKVVVIHLLHRALAYLIVLVILFSALAALFLKGLSHWRGRLFLLLVLALIQIAVGAGVIHTKVDAAVVAVHIVVAIALLSAAATTWFDGMRERVG
jgi:heme A synthase